MLFTQGNYFVFLLVVFFAYWLIAGRARWRVALLVGASLFFYAQAGVKPLLLLAALTALDYTTTRLMQHGAKERRRKLLLSLSLCADLGALCVFKYADFFLASAAQGLSFC